MAKPADCHLEAPLTTDADRLEGAGIPLRLGERDVRVRFHNRAMKTLESHYGSLAVLNETLQRFVKGEHPTPYTEASVLMLPALAHEGVTADEFEFNLGPRDFHRVRQALVDAINEGFPDASGKEDEGDQGEVSPGATSTTSPPSDSVAATTSSGT